MGLRLELRLKVTAMEKVTIKPHTQILALALKKRTEIEDVKRQNETEIDASQNEASEAERV